MSQVIVTDDNLKASRDKTRTQEHKIDVATVSKRWQKSDISGKDPLLTIIGFAMLPIVAFWALLTGAMALCVAVVEFSFRFFGQLIGGTRSLITGERLSASRKSDEPK